MRLALVPVLLAAMLAGACDRQSPSGGQGDAAGERPATPAPTADEAPSGAALAGIKTFDRSHRGEAAPALPFDDAGGKPTSLAAFRGRPVLLNLWATWCVPCVKEMPTLDALAARGGRLQVVAISQDFDAAKIAPFFAKGGYKAIRPYHDPKLAFTTSFAANLPTTILYDSAGREVWRFSGDTDWAGPEAARAIAEAR